MSIGYKKNQFFFVDYEDGTTDPDNIGPDDMESIGRVVDCYFTPAKTALITKIRPVGGGAVDVHRMVANPHVNSAFYEFVNNNELLEENFRVNPLKMIGKYVVYVVGYKDDGQEYVKFFKDAEDKDLYGYVSGQFPIYQKKIWKKEVE